MVQVSLLPDMGSNFETTNAVDGHNMIVGRLRLRWRHDTKGYMIRREILEPLEHRASVGPTFLVTESSAPYTLFLVRWELSTTSVWRNHTLPTAWLGRLQLDLAVGLCLNVWSLGTTTGEH